MNATSETGSDALLGQIIAGPFPEVLRRSSAGRRCRHRKQLVARIREIAAAAERVLIRPVPSVAAAPGKHGYALRIQNVDGEDLPVSRDDGLRVLALLRTAYPSAGWSGALTWQAASNVVTRLSARGDDLC